MPENVQDEPSALLGDGRVIALAVSGSTYLWSPGTASWANGATYNNSVIGNEAGSLLLPDGSVLAGNYQFARYLPSTDTWLPTISTATIPGGQATGEFFGPSTNGGEIGPFLLLRNGTALILGANSLNGIYNPGTVPGVDDSWTLTDSTPVGPDGSKPYNHGDTPACVEPNGRVLTMVTDDQSGIAQTPGFFYEWDGTAAPGSRWSSVAYPPITSGKAGNPERTRMIALPVGKLDGSGGQILVSGLEDNGTLWLYTEDSAPANTWRPVITANVFLFFGQFILNGSQLSGLTTGADFGDDGKTATNFPIVSLVNAAGTRVWFARTVDTGYTVPGPGARSTCAFKLPAGIPAGTYTLQVSTSGVGVDPSGPFHLTLPATDMGPSFAVAISSPML